MVIGQQFYRRTRTAPTSIEFLYSGITIFRWRERQHALEILGLYLHTLLRGIRSGSCK